MSAEQEDLYRKREPSRALVAVERDSEKGRNGCVRPLATFIAQMLACRARLADFRQHRRAQPPAAAMAYASVRTVPPARRFERML